MYVYFVLCGTGQDVKVKRSSTKSHSGEIGPMANLENSLLCKRANICNTSIFLCVVGWFGLVCVSKVPGGTWVGTERYPGCSLPNYKCWQVNNSAVLIL